MENAMRCLVTGEDAAGKSILVKDDMLARASETAIDIWREGAGSNRPSFYPSRGASLLRLLTLPPAIPDGPVVDEATLSDAFFGGLGIPECRVDTTRNPTMHRTATLDYVILIEGEITLLLDEGDPIVLRPHDIVVQRATNHAWVNTGTGPATLLVAMIAADKDG